jgi:transcriptional regulator with XRE-family HTH domain
MVSACATLRGTGLESEPHMTRPTNESTDPEPGTLGYLLKMARLRQGWSQTKAGQHLGVGQPTFSKWERNVEAPDPSRLPDVAEWLDITVQEVAALKYDLEPAASTTQVLADLAELAKRVASAETAIVRMDSHVRSLTDTVSGIVRRFGPPAFTPDAENGRS